MCICSQIFFFSYDSFHVIINLFQYVETVQNVHMRHPFKSLNQLLPEQSSDSKLFKKEDEKKNFVRYMHPATHFGTRRINLNKKKEDIIKMRK